MFLCDFALVRPDEVAVADDLLAADVETIDSVGSREDEPGDGIVGSAELEAVCPPDGYIRPPAGRELADVIAAEHRCAAAGAEPQGLSGSHCLGPATCARDQEGLLDLEEEVAALVRGRPVDTEPDPHGCFE